MNIVRHPRTPAADVAAAVHDASAALGMLWVDSYSGTPGRVSPPQLRAMLAIGEHGSTNLTDLAHDLGAMLSSASRLCDRLVASGLIERTQGRDDRREVSMRLTRDGERFVASIARERQAAIGALVEAMSEEDRTALARGLEAFTVASQASRAAALPSTRRPERAAAGDPAAG